MREKIIVSFFLFGSLNAQCMVTNTVPEKFQYVPDPSKAPGSEHSEGRHPLDVNRKSNALKWKLDKDVETYHYREEDEWGNFKKAGGGIRW